MAHSRSSPNKKPHLTLVSRWKGERARLLVVKCSAFGQELFQPVRAKFRCERRPQSFTELSGKGAAQTVAFTVCPIGIRGEARSILESASVRKKHRDVVERKASGPISASH